MNEKGIIWQISNFNNSARSHQSLEYATPDEIYYKAFSNTL